MTNKKILWICLGILVAGVAVTILIFSTEPEAKTEGATVETAMLVDVTEVEQGTFEPVIVATGTVQPVEDVQLSSLVSGQIIRRDQAFTPGGYVKKNQVLLQIDPSDYENTLALRKSELLQSQTTLDTEMGRQQIASQDLQLIVDDSLFGSNPLSDEERQLVLRKPQLNAVKATIEAAKASVKQAQLNLERTTIRAPFDAHILTQNVSKGSQVSQGDNLGRIVGTDYYWVVATVPVSKLQWLKFPKNSSDQGSTVRIENPTTWPKGTYREGFLDRQIGALDGQTRLARVLVRVEDPLGQKTSSETKPMLIIGSFVDVFINANPVKNVVRIDKGLVRSSETVWVMKDDKLEIREVDIALTDDQYAYISNGLQTGDKVVTTDLSTVSNGIGLRTEGTKTENTSE
ncbi:efflux RND transporter periplasmic adaptor subunit [Maribacter cobaltidurans]|uniref:Efflux transporter periplasmic adaptor subunit n=1 Tax=Maribacter cobaltidurans TaxID=1178778 RepID=A0A223V393_9FLAO|nr:efflux RND transporter periplasmic adaptor subunit [Maribacter cobaltidurans]ASV29309.1 efflux transporter periplasmic adaptor subunit [Maribacter cobaltidurans]GGD70148.1 hemolysin D [Maribacter cobaltidurans]